MAYLQAGNRAAAHQCFTKAVEVTPEMCWQLIQVCYVVDCWLYQLMSPSHPCCCWWCVTQVLRHHNIDYVVAPYEADAQLAYLVQHRLADFVISEDSDTIPYGCQRVLFKMDKDGRGDFIQWKHICSSDGVAHSGQLDFVDWTEDQVGCQGLWAGLNWPAFACHARTVVNICDEKCVTCLASFLPSFLPSIPVPVHVHLDRVRLPSFHVWHGHQDCTQNGSPVAHHC